MPNPLTPLLGRSSSSFPNVNSKLLWKSGAILVALGMATGAFGSHGLKKRAGITPEQINAWAIASHYAVYNGLALLILSFHSRFATHKFAGPAIATGGLIFSGSIMALILARDKLRWLGPVTPLGGSLMIAGYVALAF